MKRFGLALAFGFLAVSAAPAQQPGTTGGATGPAVTTGSAPVASTGTIVTGDVMTTAPARRGLFGRVRNRNTTTIPTITNYPSTNAPIPMPATTTPGTAPIPTPMPGTAPTPRTGGTSVVVPNTGIVQASGTTVMGNGQTVTTTGYTVPMTTTPTTGRTGIIARIRARR